MIDPRMLRDNPEAIRAGLVKRGMGESLLHDAVKADEDRRAAIMAYEELRATQKAAGKSMADAIGEEKIALRTSLKEVATMVKAAEARRNECEIAYQAAVRRLPNTAHADTPPGGEEDFVVLKEVGAIPTFDFEPRNHIELGRALGAIDLERGAKVSGSRFYFLTGIGAQLEFALINMAMDQARTAGFTQMIPPSLVKPEAMQGTGFLDQAADDVYKIEGEDLYLVGTSEVPMAAYHSDEILDQDELPLRYAAFSPCFRKEAGAHGRDTQGIIRVHWFDKVEMFVYTTPDQAEAEHQRLLQWEMDFLDKLELAYRVIDVAAGDLGPSAVRKYDCEAWIPTQGKYRELTSTSNCTDFQTRRLNTRVRRDGDNGPAVTLNGTLCAMTRTIVAILETHQQRDGSVRVPAALQPYLGGLTLLEPLERKTR